MGIWSLKTHVARKPVFIMFAIHSLISGCAFYPKVVPEYQTTQDECRLYTPYTQLGMREFRLADCHDENCLIVAGLVTPWLTLAFSCSAVVASRTIRLIEYHASCPGGLIPRGIHSLSELDY